jgi:hypothetical protein
VSFQASSKVYAVAEKSEAPKGTRMTESAAVGAASVADGAIQAPSGNERKCLRSKSVVNRDQ